MPSIQDIPVEIWLDIFEYFGIADLYAFNTIFGGALFWVVGQAARKLVKKFLVSATPKIESHLVCPEFNFSSESDTDMIPPGPMPCFLVLRENLFRTFRKNEPHSTEMTIHFDFATWVDKIIGDLIFDPCCNGSEPAQLIYSSVQFHSNKKLADGSMESLLLTYQTEGRRIPARVDDKVHGDGRTTRTLSHGMPLCQLEWRTSNMRFRDTVKLPREWIDFLKDDIHVLMRFDGIPAATHTHRSRPDLRCMPCRLTHFEVDWTFLMGLELGSDERSALF